MKNCLNVCIFVILGLTRLIYGQSRDEVNKLINNPFDAIGNIEFKAVTTIKLTDLYFVVMPNEKGKIGNICNLWYCANNSFYAYDEQLNQINKKDFYLDNRGAYDGQYYQQLCRQSKGLTISKKPGVGGVITMMNPLIAAYSFLIPSKPPSNKWRSEESINLRELKSNELWARLQSQSKILQPEEKLGFHCVVIKVDGGIDDLLLTPCNYKVWLAQELGGFPIKWERYCNPGGLTESYEVTEVGTIKIPDIPTPFRYPKSGKSAWYDKKAPHGILVTKDYQILSMVVNGKIDESVFTIDPSLANYVKDLDSNRDIVLKPKIKQ